MQRSKPEEKDTKRKISRRTGVGKETQGEETQGGELQEGGLTERKPRWKPRGRPKGGSPEQVAQNGEVRGGVQGEGTQERVTQGGETQEGGYTKSGH